MTWLRSEEGAPLIDLQELRWNGEKRLLIKMEKRTFFQNNYNDVFSNDVEEEYCVRTSFRGTH